MELRMRTLRRDKRLVSMPLSSSIGSHEMPTLKIGFTERGMYPPEQAVTRTTIWRIWRLGYDHHSREATVRRGSACYANSQRLWKSRAVRGRVALLRAYSE